MAVRFLATASSDTLIGLVLTIPAVLIAMTFHEFAHAKAADMLGDETPRIQGRLNLNPFSHVDPIGFAMLIFAGFGWGRPVEINPNNFNRNMELTKAEAIVAFAGPAMNFVLAIVFMIIYVAMYAFGLINSQLMYYVALIVNYIVVINIGLGVFNLIPLPPLDGSKILMHFLPYNARAWFEKNQWYFYIGFIIIFITGIAGDIISPAIDGIYNGLEHIIRTMFNVG
ncbi:MAG: site-2 protease family protein [Clostridia bacterium]|nr:site-2 protease family protein [Clostridia bacterium]